MLLTATTSSSRAMAARPAAAAAAAAGRARVSPALTARVPKRSSPLPPTPASLRRARRSSTPHASAASAASALVPRRSSPLRRAQRARRPPPPPAAAAAAAVASAAALPAAVPVDCLLPLCAVCLAFWFASATISAALNFVMGLVGRRPTPSYADAGAGAASGRSPGLLAGIGPTRAGSSGGWVAAGVYESDIMRLPLAQYYEVPDPVSPASGRANNEAAPQPPPSSFVMPLPSSPDDWASAEAGTSFVPARKLQVLSPGRLQAGLTTSRTRQFEDLKISLVADDGGGGEEGAGGGAGGAGGAGGVGPGAPGGAGEGGDGGGSRRPGSRSSVRDVPPPGGGG